jgi:hypothetical protein
VRVKRCTRDCIYRGYLLRENPWLRLQQRQVRRGSAERERPAGYFLQSASDFLVACGHRSTRRGGSSRGLRRCRWRHGSGGGSRSRRGRCGSWSRKWFTATVHHAHFSSAAPANRGTHLGVRYADAIDQLTAQTTALANWGDQTVRLLKWDVRHTLC